MDLSKSRFTARWADGPVLNCLCRLIVVNLEKHVLIRTKGCPEERGIKTCFDADRQKQEDIKEEL
jgi:hypothetical protein